MYKVFFKRVKSSEVTIMTHQNFSIKLLNAIQKKASDQVMFGPYHTKIDVIFGTI
jgi:hypothetical protein